MTCVRRSVTLVGTLAILVLLAPVAALATPGDLDPSFGGGDGEATFDLGGGDLASTVLTLTGGRILVMGEDGNGDLALGRMAANGDPDPAFGGGDGVVSMPFLTNLDTYNALSVLSGGKVMAAVDTSGGTGTHDLLGLARFTPVGVADSSFGGGDGKLLVNFGKSFFAYDMLALPSGDLLVSGEFAQTSDDTRFLVARLNPNGSLDHSFGGGDGSVVTNFGPGADGAWRIALDSQGRIVVAGWSQEGTGTGYDSVIARYLPNGAPDHSFSGDGKVRIQLVERNDDYALGLGFRGDRIVIGVFAQFEAERHVVVMRRLPNGDPDPAFGGGDGQVITPNVAGGREVVDLAVDANGRIVVSGREDATPDQMFVLRYGPNGKRDAGFGDLGFASTTFGADAINHGMSVAGNGKIVVVGSVGDDTGVARFLP